MPSQRHLREKALLVTFALSSQDDLGLESDLLWQICLEPEYQTLWKLSRKTLKHQLLALPKTATHFKELALGLIPMIRTYGLKAEAKQLTQACKEVTQLQIELSHLHSSKTLESSQLKTCYQQGKFLVTQLQECHRILTRSSFSDPNLPALEKSFTQLIALLSRIDIIENPLQYKDKTSLTALLKAAQIISELRTEASTLAQGVLKNRSELTSHYAPLLEHYSEERLGKVERHILLLSSYEILYLKQPKAIAINEALELCLKYAQTEAKPLLNGILDKLQPDEMQTLS